MKLKEIEYEILGSCETDDGIVYEIRDYKDNELIRDILEVLR